MKLFKNIFLVLFFVGFSVHLSSQPRTTDKIFSLESKILVISGHPNLEKSKANKAILKELEKHFGKQNQHPPFGQALSQLSNQCKSGTRSHKKCGFHHPAISFILVRNACSSQEMDR